MPNWCSTLLTVHGDRDELSRFLSGLEKKTDEWGNTHYSILKSYYPVPQALVDTDAVHYPVCPENEDKIAKQTAQHAENFANYRAIDWYEWANTYWGSKWGDCDTTLVYPLTDESNPKLVFGLRSAWSPISDGMSQVSKQFPTLKFAMIHDEEAGFYLIGEMLCDGKLVYYAECEPCEDFNSDHDFSSDEYWNEYEDWKNATCLAYEEAIEELIK